MMTRYALRLLAHRLMAPEDGGGGGSGGGGDKDGEKDKGAGGGGAEDLSPAMKDLMVRHINGAVTTHLGRMRGDLEKSLSTQFSSLLDEKFASFKPKDDKPDDKRDDKAGDKKDDPEKAKLRSDLDNLTKKLTQQEEERRAEREQLLRNEERSELMSRLREAGIPEPRVKGAVALLLHDAKAIKRNGENKIVWPVKRDWGTEDLELDAGVSEWLKTDEGKAFLPPKEAKGSGAGGGKPPKPGDKLDSDQARGIVGTFLMGGGGG